jgi:uncharacterized NAD(P)/FAD-binding protein YdhS
MPVRWRPAHAHAVDSGEATGQHATARVAVRVTLGELQGPSQSEADPFVNGRVPSGPHAIRRDIPLFSNGYGEPVHTRNVIRLGRARRCPDQLQSTHRRAPDLRCFATSRGGPPLRTRGAVDGQQGGEVSEVHITVAVEVTILVGCAARRAVIGK